MLYIVKGWNKISEKSTENLLTNAKTANLEYLFLDNTIIK